MNGCNTEREIKKSLLQQLVGKPILTYVLMKMLCCDTRDFCTLTKPLCKLVVFFYQYLLNDTL